MATVQELARQAGYDSTLVISEVSGRGGAPPRSLILSGPGLPHMGAEWGVEQNVITTWYPGNGVEGTQQVLGPRELPSTWEGEWRRTQLGRHPATLVEDGSPTPIVSPHILRDTIEEFCRSGVALRVTWTVNDSSVVGSNLTGPTQVARELKVERLGRIRTARFPHDRHTDIRWTIEFHWYSRGGKGDKASNARDDRDLASAANSVEAAVNRTVELLNSKVRQVNSEKRKSATRLTLGQLETLAGVPAALANGVTRQLQQQVSRFRQVGSISQKLAGQPLQVANSFVDFARNTQSVGMNYVDEMGRVPIELQSLKSKVSDMTRSGTYFGRHVDSVEQVVRRAFEADQKVRKLRVAQGTKGALTVRESSRTRAGDVIAVYVTKEGDTPTRLSVKFYKSADHGVDILRANKMPLHTPTFAKGTPIVIPQLSTTASRS